MADLFRYIEHGFAVPVRVDAIDVGNGSDFQQSLDAARGLDEPRQRVRDAAEGFLAANFPSPTTDPATLGKALNALPRRLRKLDAVDSGAAHQAVKKLFGKPAGEVVAGADFKADVELLQNAVLAVKLVTGFGAVDSARLVAQLRAATFLVDLAGSGLADLDRASLEALLLRPVRIPQELLTAARATPPERAIGAPAENGERERVKEMQGERDALLSAYEALLALPPTHLEAVEQPAGPTLAPASPPVAGAEGAQDPDDEAAGAGAPTEVKIGAAALAMLTGAHASALSRLDADPRHASVGTVMEELKMRLQALNAKLLPLEVEGPAKVFRIGTQLFIGSESKPGEDGGEPVQPEAGPAATPDFTHAVTRPIGVGDLLVVRQRLLGYEMGDVSHIENVLEGELLRRATRRAEVSELTLAEEMETTQSQERDHQSTSRNELAGESQKEAGRQSTTTAGDTSATDYGKLVENNKTNFAQTVTARAVDSVTQRVRRQRIEHERKVFVERARHEFDNRAGEKKVRGVYQWVDRRYDVRVLNYGKRLLYDVIVPEPAAFLLTALEEAVQPEGLQLSKPSKPSIEPSDLNEFNYAYYATLYGVTGSVSPPPAEQKMTVAEARAVEGGGKITSYGQEPSVAHHGSFKLQVPDGYMAVGGYVQRVGAHIFKPAPEKTLDLYIGESHFVSFPYGTKLRVSFTMDGETGEIPVTLRSFDQVVAVHLCGRDQLSPHRGGLQELAAENARGDRQRLPATARRLRGQAEALRRVDGQLRA